jgi:hypothetical protein
VLLLPSEARKPAGLTEAGNETGGQRMLDATLTDLCGMLDVEWRQNWKEIGTGHCLGDVDGG